MNELSLTTNDQISDPEKGLTRVVPMNAFASGVDWRDRLRGLATQPAIMRALPLLGLLTVVVAAGALWLALREPPQRDLFRGLPETDRAAVAEALKQSDISFDFNDTTGALTVAESDYHEAKLSLAAQGLPKSSPDGDSLISSMPMGASRAVENEQLRSARELDLARTIEAMDNIVSARVLLAVEPPSIFVRDRSKPSASVMLNLASGTPLTEAQVQSIIHLVASSIPGLSADAVSVVDQNGRLMSRQGDTGSSAQVERHLMVQAQVEERYRRTISSLLTPMIGAENFTAEVTAEMDFSEKQATRESFPKEGARIRSEQGSWSSEPGEKASYGIPGALSNRPPEGPELTDGFQDGKDQTDKEEISRTSEKFARRFELDREISVSKEAAGSLSRLSVAVALRSPVGSNQRSEEELSAVEALVKGAIGFQAQRGDVVAIEARPFMPVEVVTQNWWEASWVSLMVRNLSALFVALALVFGIGRPLLKKFRSDKTKLSTEQQLELASDLDEEVAHANRRQTPPVRPVSLDMISSADGYSERAALIQNFVRQNPDHAALTVQDLLAEDQTEGEAVDG
ncbi:flagellar basal-body MS-ring/collar protein FliF [Parasphingorhabdus sp. JC815]|uniref:flagellar basal-body MS-ring/collar protein FliF n=1 Tax=Parasphingorhabdus sp. JC815 TaxID=3232140 RepID=UPI0034593EF5